MGVSERALVVSLRRGEVSRAHRGCYSLPDVPEGEVLANIFRAQPTCVTLAEGLGLPTVRSDQRAHLLVPESRGLGLPRARPSGAVVLHRMLRSDSEQMPASGVSQVNPWVRGWPNAPIPRVGTYPPLWRHLDIASHCLRPLDHLALVDVALNKGLLTRSQLERFCHGTRAHRRFLVMNADAGSQSIGETYARLALRGAGLVVRTQAPMLGVGRVDLLVEGRVVVEIDGYEFHSDKKQFAVDRRRDRRLVLAGYGVLRFTHEEARLHTASIVDDVLALVAVTSDPRQLRTGNPRRAAHPRSTEAA